MTNMTKLNLGSGVSGPAALNVITLDHAGWKFIDICKDYYAHEHYDIATGIKEPDNSIEIIWMGDFFEHLLRLKAKFVMQECYRVLKPGGMLIMAVPDMEIVMPLWLKANGDDESNAQLIWGQQDEVNQKNSLPDAHLYGYTEYSLKKLLSSTGFSKISRTGIHKNWYELAIKAYK